MPAAMKNILIVDDVDGIRELLSDIMTAAGYAASGTGSLAGMEALLASRRFDAVFLDVTLPDGNGLEAISRIRSRPGGPDVIVITGKAQRGDAVQALENGAWDYLQKPLDRGAILAMLDRLFQFRGSAALNGKESASFEALLGASPAITTAIGQLNTAAAGDSNLHLYGETGTGKDLAARLVHNAGPRAKGEFVIVDCAILSDLLGQSHLFGHLRGAFTGAVTAREGLIAQAHDGTLFLDEVGELSLEMQKVFLRVLQEKTFTPLGAAAPRFSDFRIISATNRNLPEMVRQGLFREDLYYRLRGIVVAMPPLRARDGDIRLLAEMRCQQLAARMQRPPKELSPAFTAALQAHSWPGNVRELFSVIDAATQLTGDFPALLEQHLPASMRLRRLALDTPPGEDPAHYTDPDAAPATPGFAGSPPKDMERNALLLPDGNGDLPSLKDAREKALHEVERKYLLELMNMVGSDIGEACAISGLSRSRLYMYLQRHDIRRQKWQ